MSYNNFKPVVLSAKIQRELEKDCTLVMGCNREFEGEATQGGRVKIPNLGRPTIKDYHSNTPIDDAEVVPDGSVYLDIDQASYFNFQVEDIDKALSKGNLMDALIAEAKSGIAEKQDAFVGSLALKAPARMTISSVGIATPDAAMEQLKKALLMLRNNHVKSSMKIYADVPWWFYELIVDKTLDLDTDNSEVLAGGVLRRVRDIYLRPTNMLHQVTASSVTDDLIMVRTKKAIAFAAAIDKLEPYRPEKAFADAVKGVAAYGGKIVRPEQMVVIKAHKSTQSA